MNLDLARLLGVAHEAVDLAESRIRDRRPHFIHVKGDRDITTDVDLDIERLVHQCLSHATPQVGFLGEENGGDQTGTRWVLDPVDGTANYTRGLPCVGTSLTLIHQHRPVIGVIALPLLGHRYWAADRLGAWRNHTPIRAASTSALSE